MAPEVGAGYQFRIVGVDFVGCGPADADQLGQSFCCGWVVFSLSTIFCALPCRGDFHVSPIPDGEGGGCQGGVSSLALLFHRRAMPTGKCP